MENHMKKFFQYLIIILLFSLWGIILTNRDQTRTAVKEVKTAAQKQLKIDQPCSKPLTYAIGNIDPKFNISADKLKELAQQAADIWNKADGKMLLKYDPNSSFKINLVYDTRQEATNAASELQNKLDSLETTDNNLKDEYDSLNAVYKKKIDEYNKDVTDYKDNLEAYNKEVEYWNAKGGAPKDEYEKLQDKKDDLDDEYDDLNKERKEINGLIEQANGIAKKDNQIIANYNSNVATYRNEYGGAHEFEKGVFDGKEINIYEFRADDDLRLTLAHELGHYLGMDHVQNSKSIMYYLIGDQNMKNPVPTAEDLAALRQICK